MLAIAPLRGLGACVYVEHCQGLPRAARHLAVATSRSGDRWASYGARGVWLRHRYGQQVSGAALVTTRARLAAPAGRTHRWLWCRSGGLPTLAVLALIPEVGACLALEGSRHLPALH